jgi:hypothetical protein
MPRCLFLSFLALYLYPLPRLAAEGDPNGVSFERDVKPLLTQHCARCHDARKKTAEFRIDVRSVAFAGGESKHAGIVAGKPEASELYKRLVTDDEDLQMPPGGEKLPAADIAKVKAWIAGGAKWPDSLANEPATAKHWAFIAPVRPAVPAGAANPIDAFVRARLTKEGLKASPPADRVTLMRRLHLDLTGLPPTPSEVDAFVADTSPDAVNKLVEKLLASPHHGEKWGRFWLDAARYADSDGYEKDKPRFVHFYRDYVINALNTDMPYNRFIIEQVAGDLLPKPTQDQVTATGFLRNSMINEEGGIDPEQFRMEAMFDRMDAVGKSVLGLTLACAQCHTHKYDPITHTDYYRLFAFLNSAHEATATVYTPDGQMRRETILRKVAALESELRHRTPDWRESVAAWAKSLPAEPAWVVAKPALDGSGGQKLTLQADGSVLAEGYAPTKHSDSFVLTLPPGEPVTAVRLELLTDPTLPHGGPGRSVTGMFGLTEVAVSADGKPVAVTSATSDADAPVQELAPQYADKTNRKRTLGPVAYAIDGDDKTAWSVDVGPGRRNVPRKAVFALKAPITRPKGVTVTVRLSQQHGGWNSDDNQTNNLGRFRFSVTTAKGATADPLSPKVRGLVSKASRTEAEDAALFSAYRLTVPAFKEVNYDIESLWKDHPEGASQLVLAAMGTPRTTHRLKRGDFLSPAEAVVPGTPAFLHPMAADATVNRLTLAKWLVDPKSPTTARAFVNRVWQAYFGRGIVGTPDDLGIQGDPPTHPELLDWLAVEFMHPSDPAAKPWSVKHLHRLITASETYRQSSLLTPEAVERDPANKWLGRGPRFRVEGEIVRDIALAASGLLNPAVGGPSVYPPIPEFLLLPPASYGPKTWPVSTGGDRYRRSVYVFRFRSIPYPALQAFDTPNGDVACVKRTVSNTPLQALVGLNEPTFLDAARGLAARTLKHAGDDAARLTHAFRLCVSRTPTIDELAVLTNVLAKERKRFAADDARPEALVGDLKAFPAPTTPAEAAAWASVARVLLNLDETLTKN